VCSYNHNSDTYPPVEERDHLEASPSIAVGMASTQTKAVLISPLEAIR